MEIGIEIDGAIAFNTGSRRASSSTPLTGAAPGRVDSAPMSIRSAPAASMARAMSRARLGSSARPPSEKESGVTLITPITKQRGPSTRGARPGIGTVNERRGALITQAGAERRLLLRERLADRLHRRDDGRPLFLLRRRRIVAARHVGG